MGGDCKLVEVAAELWTLADAGRGLVGGLEKAWRRWTVRSLGALLSLLPLFPARRKQKQPEIAHNNAGSVDMQRPLFYTWSYARCRYLVMAVSSLFSSTPHGFRSCATISKLYTIDDAYE